MENKVKYHLNTRGDNDCIALLSLKGMKAGSPELVSRGKGKSGSTSLNDLRGCPPMNL